MHDVSDALIPEDAAVDQSTHEAFIGAMAALHALFWKRPPSTTYMPFEINYRMLSPSQAKVEREHHGDASDVLRLVEPGWARVGELMPDLYAVVKPLLADPRPLVGLLATTPVTFLQGDWKMGNLGRRDDGRVVLVDWDRPSIGPATAELAWYV